MYVFACVLFVNNKTRGADEKNTKRKGKLRAEYISFEIYIVMLLINDDSWIITTIIIVTRLQWTINLLSRYCNDV